VNPLRQLIAYCDVRYDKWRYRRHLKRLDGCLEDLRDKEQKLQAIDKGSRTVMLVMAQARWVIEAVERQRLYVQRMLQHLDGQGAHPDDILAEYDMAEVLARLRQDPDGSKVQDNIKRLRIRIDDIQKRS